MLLARMAASNPAKAGQVRPPPTGQAFAACREGCVPKRHRSRPIVMSKSLAFMPSLAQMLITKNVAALLVGTPFNQVAMMF